MCTSTVFKPIGFFVSSNREIVPGENAIPSPIGSSFLSNDSQKISLVSEERTHDETVQSNTEAIRRGRNEEKFILVR